MKEPYVEDMLINPFYAINILPSLSEKHKSLVTKKQWVKANAKLMDKIGTEEWLGLLLDILESGDPRSFIKKSI
jgi:hypothetical protein